jgi:glucose-6-phosphate isomerase
VQRPLWASTGVKDPALPDTLYVTELVAPGTVNTMPEKTLEATFDHGVVTGDTVTGAYADAHRVFDELAAGVDIADVTQLLEDEGVAKFIASWQDLKKTVAEALGAAPETAGEFRDPRLGSRQAGRRRPLPVWSTAWSPAGSPPATPTCGDRRRHPRPRVRLGWVDAVSVSRPLVAEIEALRADLVGRGSPASCSPGWAVRRSPRGDRGDGRSAAGDPRLDRPGRSSPRSTVTGAAASPRRSSSSPRSRVDRRDRLRTTRLRGCLARSRHRPRRAHRRRHRPGIAARHIRARPATACSTPTRTSADVYSALTAFGLVPSGLAGVDISELDEAEATLLEVAIDDPRNPALVLAAAIAGSATGIPRRDKLGLVPTARTSWACPTGSSSSSRSPPARRAPASSRRPAAGVPGGRADPGGPAARAPRGRRGALPAHRAAPRRDPRQRFARRAVRGVGVRDGHRGTPAGHQPVRSARRRVRKAAGSSTRAPRPEPGVRQGGVEVRVSDAALAASGTSRACSTRWARLGASGYVAIQAYVDRTAVPQLAGLRELVAADSGRPTTVRLGSAFLHSTGQYHKGGPADGVFCRSSERVRSISKSRVARSRSVS